MKASFLLALIISLCRVASMEVEPNSSSSEEIPETGLKRKFEDDPTVQESVKRVKTMHIVDEPAIQVTPLENNDRRIVLFNLGYDVTEEDIFNFFSSFGTITTGKLYRNEGSRSGQFCFLVYLTQTSAAKAIQSMTSEVMAYSYF